MREAPVLLRIFACAMAPSAHKEIYPGRPSAPLAFARRIVSQTRAGAAGPGVSQSMLGTLHLSNGTVQVTYGGHPLYTYLGDRKPGQTTGQSIKSFGGIWYVLSAATGQAIS